MNAAPNRLAAIDLLRGAAVWAMAAYHFTWDLGNFGWIDADRLASPIFHWIGHGIAASFLLLVGFSLALARQSKGVLWRSGTFWRRWATVAAAAGAISAVSIRLFPQSPIFFGILHCIALSSLIAMPLVDAPPLAALVGGAFAWLAPHFLISPFFDAKMFWWTGLSTFEPSSHDYRPLLPWLAFVLFGLALGRWAKLPLPARKSGVPDLRSSLSDEVGDRRLRCGERGIERAPFRATKFCGRHSLPIYLVHQPILFGLFLALGLVVTPPPSEKDFLHACAENCVNQGATSAICEKACACMIDRAKQDGFWTALARAKLTSQQKSAAHDEAVACYAFAAGQ